MGKKLVTINKLEKDIIRVNSEMESAARMATEKGLFLGSLLLMAREQFTSDQDFGTWRGERTPVSADMASRLMQISKEFQNDKRAKELPISTLREMLPLPEPIKQELLDREKPPTVKEVREIKAGDIATLELKDDIESEGQDEDKHLKAADAAAERKAKMDARKQNVTGTMAERAEIGMKKPWKERFREFNGGGDEALRAFGLCEFDEYLPNPEVIEILHNFYIFEIDENDEALVALNIDNAHDEIMAMYEEQEPGSIYE